MAKIEDEYIMARANLNKSEVFLTNTNAASKYVQSLYNVHKYIPRRPIINYTSLFPVKYIQ